MQRSFSGQHKGGPQVQTSWLFFDDATVATPPSTWPPWGDSGVQVGPGFGSTTLDFIGGVLGDVTGNAIDPNCIAL
jgi:hypothetical protein